MADEIPARIDAIIRQHLRLEDLGFIYKQRNMIVRLFIFFICLVNSIISVSAQDIAVAYREKDRWGYADTLGHILLPPLYDDVRRGSTLTTTLMVAKNKKWGVVNTSGKIVLPLAFDQIYPYNNTYFLTVNQPQGESERGLYDLRQGLYTLKGQPLVSPDKQEIQFIKPDVIIVRSQKESAKCGVGYITGTKVKWLIPRVNKEIYFKTTDSVFVTENGEKKTEYKLTGGSRITKMNESTIPVDEYGVVEATVDDDREIYQGPIEEFKVTLSTSDSVMANGKKMPVLVQKSEAYRRTAQQKVVLSGCDMIQIVQYPNGGNETFFQDKKRTKTTSWAIIRKNGKYGAYFPVPERMIPCEYDSIAPAIIPYLCKGTVVKAKRNGKWGLIRVNGNVVTDFKYDDILFNSEEYYGSNYQSCFRFQQGMIVKLDERYNILRDSATLAHPHGFQNIQHNGKASTSSIVVFEGNKKGFYKDGYLFQPLYEGQGNFREIYTDRYPLVEIVDQDKRVLGYADRKGIVYFKD